MEGLALPFMQKALFTGLLISVLSGMISVFIVLRRMSFVGAGISHAAFGGVAIGFFTGLNPLATAIVYTIVIAIGIDVTSKRAGISGDVSIGIFYAVSMALGVALVSLSRSYTIDLFGYLFGNILAITAEDLVVTIVTAAVVTGVILAFLKELFLMTYNEELAQISGVPVRAWNVVFLIILSVAIVVSIRVVGIILVSALLVIPGATARLHATGLRSMLFLSCLTAAISVAAGLLLSYEFDVAPGATIVLTASALFFLSLIVRGRS